MEWHWPPSGVSLAEKEAVIDAPFEAGGVMAMLLHLEKQVQELRAKLGIEHGTPSGLDTRSLPDTHSHGRLDRGSRREPPLLFG